MTRKTLAPTFLIIVLLGCVSIAWQAQFPTQTAGSAVAAQATTASKIVLKDPSKKIVVFDAVAFTVTKEIDGKEHIYEFLLGPHPISTAPASGWFIEDAGQPLTFYLESGYVYVTHSVDGALSNQPAAALDETTRPRVRTKRVLAQGKGTIMLVQAFENSERVFALELDSGHTVNVKGLSKGAQEENLNMAQFCTITESGEVNNPATISANPEPKQFKDTVIIVAGSFGLNVP